MSVTLVCPRRVLAAVTATLLALSAGPAAAATTTDPVLPYVGTTPGGSTLTLLPGQTTRLSMAPGSFEAFRAQVLSGEDSETDAMLVAGRRPFDTLSAALVGTFAEQTGVSVDAFVATNPLQQASLMPRMTGTTSLQSLDASLATSGLSFSASGATSLRSWASSLAATPSIDGIVTLQAASWADGIASMAMPKLRSPGAVEAPAMTDEALLFGLFAKDSFTTLASRNPDAFAEVSRSGVTSPNAKAAFGSAMRESAARLSEGAAGGLFDGCSSAFLGSMATGDASVGTSLAGRGCGGCAAAGVAANSMVNRLYNTGSTANSMQYIPKDGVISPQEWSQMPSWVKKDIVASNPKVGESLKPKAPASTMCSGGVSDVVGATLPGVMRNVTGR
jgi:hypothetical protein